MSEHSRRTVLATWLVLAAVAAFPWARAVAFPPEGTSFAGTFHWIDDIHAYLAYAQQAEDGHLLLRNRFGAPAALREAPRLVNLEWTVVGWISRALGREPHLAFRLMGLLASLGALAALHAWLVALGVPDRRRLASLLLVAVGGGFGGLIFLLTDWPVQRCVDLSHGISAFTGLLANGHWTASLALQLGTLYAFTRYDASPRAYWAGGMLGTALAFVRPYDVVTVAMARGAAVIVEGGPVVRRLLPLLTLAPATSYLAWVLLVGDEYRLHSAAVYAPGAPSRADTMLALIPLIAVALPGLPRRRHGETWRWPLAAWAAFGVAMTLVRPVSFAMQYAVALAVPLLALGASWLARRPGWWLAAAFVALGTTAPVALRIVLAPDQWFVPRERWAAGRAVRGTCAPGDRLFSPPDVGLYAGAFSSCDIYVGHSAQPEYGARLAAVRGFYGGASPAARAALLDGACITHVLLPGAPGPRAEPWLPPAAGFTAIRRVVVGAGMTLYRRDIPDTCAPKRGTRARDRRSLDEARAILHSGSGG